MFKREYFVRAKIAHDNDTGLYTWWSGTVCIESFFEMKGCDIFNAAMDIAYDKMHSFEGESVDGKKVQIEALNRI